MCAITRRGTHFEAVQQFVDAGFSNIAIVPIGDDFERTMDFWEASVRPMLEGID